MKNERGSKQFYNESVPIFLKKCNIKIILDDKIPISVHFEENNYIMIKNKFEINISRN